LLSYSSAVTIRRDNQPYLNNPQLPSHPLPPANESSAKRTVSIETCSAFFIGRPF
jgi:hypothetical protein